MASAEHLTKEMESFYRQYIDAFNAEELTGLAGHFSYPWGLIGGNRGLVVIKDQADFVRSMEKTKDFLRNRGWGRTGVDRVHAWPTADNMGLLMTDFTRYREDGSVLERGRACYTVRRDAGAWKIVT
ncbi:MAG: hypothetical protein ACLQU2_18380, partial [Candidatus Binataceae bacterium]